MEDLAVEIVHNMSDTSNLQTNSESAYLSVALDLQAYIVSHHWDGQAIVGPDPIGKVNWRITRFIRSYFPWIFRDETQTYMQGQGYWIRANLELGEISGTINYHEIAASCANFILKRQLSDGAWEHPSIPGRKGFISTVETVWACLGLMAANQKFGRSTYLEAAKRGYKALIQVIGLREHNGNLAVNYYAHSNSLVPNVTSMSLWLMASLFQVTQDEEFLRYSDRLIGFLEQSQMKNGELMYVVGRRPHFQCYQYNAFQFIDLANYYEIVPEQRVHNILNLLAQFLSTGVSSEGSCHYDCFKSTPEVNYWTGALAAALLKAGQMGLGNYSHLSERAYQHLLSRQKTDGGFNFSSRNYYFLRDSRSYPRYLAMILHQLLARVKSSLGGMDTVVIRSNRTGSPTRDHRS